MTDEPSRPDSTNELSRPHLVEERLARLEREIEGRKWYWNPGWWSVILWVAVLVLQIQPWEWFEGDEPGTVKLIEGHASAFAENQWDADLRVVNGTSRAIVVERVQATFWGAQQRSGLLDACAVSGVAITRAFKPQPL